MNRRQFVCGGLGLAATAALPRCLADAGMEVDGIALPDWAVAEIRDGLARYRVWKGADETVTFPLVTDLHSHLPAADKGRNWGDSKSHVLFQRAIARETEADFLANLGDLDLDVNILGAAPPMDKVRAVLDDFTSLYRGERRPVLFAMGNHDHAKGRFTSQEFGDAFNRGMNVPHGHDLHLSPCGTWGYLDLPVKRFRAVFLNTSDEGYLGFSVAQLQFLSDTLASTPADWHVAVMQHADIPCFIARWRRGISDASDTKRSGIEMQLIEDFANRREGPIQGWSKTAVRGQYGGVKWSFENARGNLAGVFQGHLHAESFLKYAKVPYVIRPGYGTIPLDAACGEWRDPKRDPVTHGMAFSPAKSMMIDLVAIKPSKRTVHVFRIGFGGPQSELEYVY